MELKNKITKYIVDKVTIKENDKKIEIVKGIFGKVENVLTNSDMKEIIITDLKPFDK